MTTALSFDFSKRVVLKNGVKVNKLPASGIVVKTAADFLIALRQKISQAHADPVIAEFLRALKGKFSDHQTIRPLINYAIGNGKTHSRPMMLDNRYHYTIQKFPFVKIYVTLQEILRDRPDYIEALRKIGIAIELSDPSLEKSLDPSLETYQVPNTLPQRLYDPADAEDQNILFSDGSFEDWLKPKYKTITSFDRVFQRLKPQRSLHVVNHRRGENHAHRHGNVDYTGPLKASYLGPLLRKATGIIEKECDESTIRTRLAAAFMQKAGLKFKSEDPPAAVSSWDLETT